MPATSLAHTTSSSASMEQEEFRRPSGGLQDSSARQASIDIKTSPNYSIKSPASVTPGRTPKLESSESLEGSPSISGSRDHVGHTGCAVEDHEQELEGEGEDGRTGEKRKRRKVNHACVYCRRSHMTCDQNRPCSRCIKRNIGHLCHDELREIKKGKDESESKQTRTDSLPKDEDSMLDLGMDSLAQPLDSGAEDLPQSLSTSGNDAQDFDVNSQLYTGWDTGLQSQSQLHDVHNYHPNYMFNTSEVTNEYNLINDFLSTSLLDDGAFYQDGTSTAAANAPGSGTIDSQILFADPTLTNIMGPLSIPNSNTPWPNAGSLSNQLAPPGSHLRNIGSITGASPPLPSYRATATTASTQNTASTSKTYMNKAQEKYYMTAADPAGTDTPEVRMNKLLKAKYEAGLLKPFNYVKGYARLNSYMERTVQPATRLRVLRQIDKFRPKFRERMQRLTDVELVMVEIWFERKLMEYDRVFASMAMPACCWRRTGEIFRGNSEMAALIKVPLERLRDGKLAIHEIFVEDSLVSYWEKFGAIAFETSQKAILTSCSLKSPGGAGLGGVHGLEAELQELRCCFSFTIQRDTHAIPSLIIGNFLPILPAKS